MSEDIDILETNMLGKKKKKITLPPWAEKLTLDEGVLTNQQ